MITLPRYRSCRIVGLIPFPWQCIREREPACLRFTVHVRRGRSVDIALDIGAHDVHLPGPPLRAEKQGGAAVGAKTPLGIRGGAIPAQGAVRGKAKLFFGHAHPCHQRRAVGALAQGAVTVGAPQAGGLVFEAHLAAQAGAVKVVHGFRPSNGCFKWQCRLPVDTRKLQLIRGAKGASGDGGGWSPACLGNGARRQNRTADTGIFNPLQSINTECHLVALSNKNHINQ